MSEYSDNLTVADVGAVPDGNLFIDSDGDLCIAGRNNNLVACLATDDADGNWQPLNPDVFPEIVRRWNAHTSQPSETVAEALKPFADMVRYIDPEMPDDYRPSWAEFLVVGDFRRAAAALQALKGE